MVNNILLLTIIMNDLKTYTFYLFINLDQFHIYAEHELVHCIFNTLEINKFF